jgi:hypothetical protein
MIRGALMLHHANEKVRTKLRESKPATAADAIKICRAFEISQAQSARVNQAPMAQINAINTAQGRKCSNERNDHNQRDRRNRYDPKQVS